MKYKNIFLIVFAYFVFYVNSISSMEENNNTNFIDEKRNKFYQEIVSENNKDLKSLFHYHRSVSEPLNCLIVQLNSQIKERTLPTPTLEKKEEGNDVAVKIEKNDHQLIIKNQKSAKELYETLVQIINLKSQTIYCLEGMKIKNNSKNPLLITPEDISFIFREGLGIDKKVLQEVDPEKLWKFIIQFIDLPTPRLPETKKYTSLGELFINYQELINNLLVLLEIRLKEDVYSFQVFCTRDAVNQKGKLKLEQYIKEEEEGFSKIKLTENMKLNMLKLENQTPNSLLAPSKLFEGILKAYGHNQEKQAIEEIWLTTAAGKDHQEFIQRLYGAVKCKNISGWNPEEDMRIEVKAKLKLQDNPESDVSEEFMTSTYKILGRHITKQVLEVIKHNFERAISESKIEIDYF